LPIQVARREVPALIAAAAERLGKDLSKADISGVEPYLESIDEFVGALPDAKKPKKSSGDNGDKQKSKPIKKSDE